MIQGIRSGIRQGIRSGINPIDDPALDPDMVLVYDTTLSEGTTITLPLGGTVDVEVDWGDGTTNTYTSAGNYDHTYGSEGTYTVRISGSLTRYGDSITQDKLVECKSLGWGLGVTSLRFAFHNAANLVEAPHVIPPGVTDMRAVFDGASVFNGDIGGWDMSSATNTGAMFRNAALFNKPIGEWDVSSVTNMDSMFQDAAAFNQPIGGWDVSSVTSMRRMFGDDSSFNQPIGGWDVSSVTDMSRMFLFSDFNQPIGAWDVSSVTDFLNMFWGSSFEQAISEWEPVAAQNMSGFMNNTQLSTPDYDAVLIAWDGLALHASLDEIHFGDSKYTPGGAAEAARTSLIGKGINIIDGGPAS